MRCAGCGVVRQWPPLPEETAAAIYGNIYPAAASTADSPPPARRAGRNLTHLRDEVLARHATPGRFLDIGCSYGELVGLFAEAGWRASGIDVCAAAVDDARRRGLDCRATSVEGFEPSEPFDAITMSHVIEHVPDPLAALARIRTWLAPGGTLHIRVPNVDAAPLRRSRMVFVGELKPYEHLFYYSPDTMARLLAKAGFACEVSTGGRYPLGVALNAMVRTRLVASARWQKYNYFTPSGQKGLYFALRRAYEASLLIPNQLPLSNDREVRAVASVDARSR